MTDKPLVSPEYAELNKELHGRNRKYGAYGHEWADRIAKYMKDAERVLDYGCGKMTLLNDLKKRFPERTIDGYDPATLPEMPTGTYDFVICNDVMEHVEPEYIDNVLAHLAELMGTEGRGLLVISLRKANKTLADGRNAHLTIENAEWWTNRLRPYFSEITRKPPSKRERENTELAVIVKP